ncbi:membrane-bound O-acyltransferase family protein [Meridianimarinicoccus roseus]|uniref:Probable alginate O-acetylase AlgI n=1 Tax=Meridianimarinicoccus roseus TaxID=2072018 RepID=A0A2V2LNG4_9RHOB|nr:MBOAT family O-acyltransferase [Meridianimarinicoccus roseus]PWR04557.1 membrane-bound O-acyltransferase family protein [Meridianimarinicoccus roseus]
MLFHSFEYAALLALVFAAYLVLPVWTRWIVLVTASYVFYATSQFGLVWLLMASGGLDYVCGLAIFHSRRQAVRRAFLMASITGNLGLLAYFKYRVLLVDGFDYLTGGGFVTTMDAMILPIGISFFTLQSMGYTIDVFRGKQVPEKHPGYFFLYVAYFPQLIAGPIERARDLLPQLRAQRPFDWTRVRSGGLLILSGLLKKLVIVSSLTPFFAEVYEGGAPANPVSLLIATSLSLFYIYADFSGYTDLARGSSRLIGIELSRNFRSPMLASSIRDFWQRWHMTLTKWIFDYLHAPLAGLMTSRAGRYAATFVTFIVVGLWHGANVTFILFGALHGTVAVLETICVRQGWTLPSGPVWQALRIARTAFLGAVFCTLFLSPSLFHAGFVYRQLLDLRLEDLLNASIPHKLDLAIAAFATGVWMAQRFAPNILTDLPRGLVPRWSLYLGLIGLLVLLSQPQGAGDAFIYFQF